MRDVAEQVLAWQREGERVAVATVVEVVRSAPRQPGTKLAVTAGGRICGQVSGGCVEGAVVELAEAILDGAPPQLVRFGSDADPCGIGLPCGGEIAVWVEAVTSGRFAELALSGGRAAEITVVCGPHAGAKLLIEADSSRSGSLGSVELDAAAEHYAADLLWEGRSALCGELFVDVVAPPPHLVLVGAVDIAAALATLAKPLDLRVTVIDPRARYATPERFPDADAVLAMWPEPAYARIGGLDAATAVVVMTHDPKLDDAALIAALRSDAGFVGAMGSRPAQAERRTRLLAAGLTLAELERLSAPVGLDLGGATPAETALSILAEVVAVRHGRRGGRLEGAEGRIHAVV